MAKKVAICANFLYFTAIKLGFAVGLCAFFAFVPCCMDACLVCAALNNYYMGES